MRGKKLAHKLRSESVHHWSQHSRCFTSSLGCTPPPSSLSFLLSVTDNILSKLLAIVRLAPSLEDAFSSRVECFLMEVLLLTPRGYAAEFLGDVLHLPCSFCLHLLTHIISWYLEICFRFCYCFAEKQVPLDPLKRSLESPVISILRPLLLSQGTGDVVTPVLVALLPNPSQRKQQASCVSYILKMCYERRYFLCFWEDLSSILFTNFHYATALPTTATCHASVGLRDLRAERPLTPWSPRHLPHLLTITLTHPTSTPLSLWPEGPTVQAWLLQVSTPQPLCTLRFAPHFTRTLSMP